MERREVSEREKKRGLHDAESSEMLQKAQSNRERESERVIDQERKTYT